MLDNERADTGFWAVWDGDGWFYLDETREVALGPYERAECFHNGLARVCIGNHEGYIDAEGNEVYFWDYK